MTDRLLPWSLFADRVPHPVSPAMFAFDGRYRAAAYPLSSRRVVRFTDGRTGREVARHHLSDPAWQIQKVFLSAPWALVVETIDPPPREASPTRAFRYDLRTGAVTSFASVETLPQTWFPQPFDVEGGRVAYSGRVGGRGCLVVAELATLRGRPVYCSAATGWLPGLPQLAGGTLSVMDNQNSRPHCRHQLVVDVDGGRPTRAAERAPCTPFDGVATAGFTVHTELAPNASNYDRAALVAASRTGPLLPLGLGAAGSLRVCRGWAYWHIRFGSSTEDATEEIRRWRPGSTVQVVYRTPRAVNNGWVGTTRVSCHGGQLMLARAWTGGGPERGQQILTATAPED